MDENVVLNKLTTIWPEVVMLLGAVVCLITGLAPKAAVRRATPAVAAAALIIAGLLVGVSEPTSSIGLAGMVGYLKLAVVGVGLVLLLVAAHIPEQLKQLRQAEASAQFDPGNIIRGEVFAFFLFSLTGVMLTAGADDLVWLFLALELTSLPTYILVSTGREKIAAQESGVKYFFLGAMSAAVFVYGFALIYGATGYTDFANIRAALVEGQQVSLPLLTMGVVLSVLGISFKIAAVPMHFYAADVYEGAETSITAFLAFVPKTAGFAALILLFGLIGWPLGAYKHGEVLIYLLWGLAAVTMTFGNVLALLQNKVKRVLAYSSIAHSGYLLVGLIAGTGAASAGALSNGVAAILFYLVAYGLGTIAAFAVLGCLRENGDEAESFDAISGLVRRQPMLAGILLLSMLSLIGLPPLIGFFGKIYLIGSVYEAGFNVLVVILVLNSAVSAAYYLRIASVAFFGQQTEGIEPVRAPSRVTGAAVAGVTALLLGLPIGLGSSLAASAQHAATPQTQTQTQSKTVEQNANAPAAQQAGKATDEASGSAM
jgi:NADH-quinone oxidoreductase subunit N